MLDIDGTLRQTFAIDAECFVRALEVWGFEAARRTCVVSTQIRWAAKVMSESSLMRLPVFLLGKNDNRHASRLC